MAVAITILAFGTSWYGVKECFGIIPANKIQVVLCRLGNLEELITLAKKYNTRFLLMSRWPDDLAYELKEAGFELFYLDIPSKGEITWKLMK